MAKLEKVERVITKLRAKAAAKLKGDKVSVVVGYTASYAIFVHENMEPKTLGQSVPRPSGLGVYWGPANAGPKFLENPLREMKDELARIVTDVVKKGNTLAQALVVAGLRLQRESMLRVPVEYGVLKASAFTRLET